MGAILDLLKDIPLSAVIRERLSQAETKIAALEQENTALTAQIKQLQALREQPNLQRPADDCPYCRRKTGILQRMEPIPGLELHGVQNGYYKCSCGKTYQKQITM